MHEELLMKSFSHILYSLLAKVFHNQEIKSNVSYRKVLPDDEKLSHAYVMSLCLFSSAPLFCFVFHKPHVAYVSKEKNLGGALNDK